MADFTESLGQDNLNPLSEDKRTMNFFSTFSIWVGAQVVVTTVLTGMLLVPDLTYGAAILIIIAGTLVGAVPLVLMGNIGTRSGLPTMILTRGAFGHRGSVLPSVANVITLIGWSWVQAYLGGLSLNYAVTYLTGYSNINLFVVLTESIIVMIAIFGHKGIEKTENIIASTMLVLSVIVFAFMFIKFDIGNLVSMAASKNPKITAVAAFDMVVATAFSQVAICCDFNRFCKSEKTAVSGTYVGYLFASLVAFGLGVTVAGFSILGGVTKTYDPTILIGGVNPVLGFAAGIVIFLSVVSTNAMVLYAATMSYLAIFSRHRFWKVALTMGIICVLGALAKEMLINHFQDFLLMIGTLFIPITAIVLVDYYIIKHKHYDAEEIISGENKQYWYSKGVNYIGYVSYTIGAAFAYYFSYVQPLPTGSTLWTFLITCFVYWGLMKMFSRTNISYSRMKKNKNVGA
ncbi:purine-cytosine permease family protein [Virgibacillus dakarensis]|uniref:purine-cytosine permease family protein n=1 Tax=Virgibacillus dakarensis TaxID=1917889 RepID=UPI000B4545DC|nr:cytosine permease [Virgibacillus dakarensis]